MRNEMELTKKYFDTNEIPNRRKMWEKIIELEKRYLDLTKVSIEKEKEYWQVHNWWQEQWAENSKLKERLQNSIEVNFKFGQEVYVIDFVENGYGLSKEVIKKNVDGIMKRHNDIIYLLNSEIYTEKEIFATEKEANEKINDILLKGEY